MSSLDELADSEIDRLVEINLIGHDLKHPGFYWAEGTTEDGDDGWEGWSCPRCGVYGDPDKGSPEPCVKRYTYSLDEVLKIVDQSIGMTYIQITFFDYGWSEADYYDGEEHYFGDGKTAARAACIAMLESCGDALRTEVE